MVIYQSLVRLLSILYMAGLVVKYFMMQTTTRWQLSENSALISVYAWLRLIIAAILLLLYLFYSNVPDLGSEFPQIFYPTSMAYFIVALIAAFYLHFIREKVSIVVVLSSFLIDIAAIILMAHASGGVGSGLPTMLVVMSSIAAILLGPRLAVFIAALASLAILFETSYRALYLVPSSRGSMLAGLYGMACFAASLLISNISSRLRDSQQLAQKRAADVEKLQFLNQLVIERLRTGLMVLDWHGQLLMANGAAKKLIFSHQNGIGNEWPVRLPDEIKILFEQWRSDPRNQPHSLRLASGAPYLQINFTSLSHQPEGDVLAFIEDQTELSQRAQQMKLASLGRFSASIAHEIRNPLGAISHAAQLLAESVQLDEQDKQLSDIIQKHCLRMNRVIESVLKLSRRQNVKQSQFLLDEWLNKFLGEFGQSKHDSQDVQVDASSGLSVKFDSDHLVQIMNNLIDNGLRYSELKTSVRRVLIKAYAYPDNQLACIDVIDYGNGIAEEDCEKIFEPFFTTEAQGNGLGLYLCRQLCEANQATIHWLRNTEGQSCFQILFAHPERRGWIAETV